MGRLLRALITGGLALLVTAGAVYGWLLWYGQAAEDPTSFESDIVAFEAERVRVDRPVIFMGSSSIRMWDTLAEDMAPLPVLNRGFGGSQMFHLVHYAERLLAGLSPAAIVVYEGDNDLAEGTGKGAEDVLADYRDFVSKVQRLRLDTPIYFMTIKPSLLRWQRWPEMQRANRLIEEWSARDPRLHFLDTRPALLGPDGKPREDVFLPDGLHMNAAGYAGWTAILRPRLLADLGVPAGTTPAH